MNPKLADQIRTTSLELYSCLPKDLPKIDMIIDEPNLELLAAILDYVMDNHIDFRTKLIEQGQHKVEKIAQNCLSPMTFFTKQYLDNVKSKHGTS